MCRPKEPIAGIFLLLVLAAGGWVRFLISGLICLLKPCWTAITRSHLCRPDIACNSTKASSAAPC
ncbi:hypothetical protein PsyrH_14295 [Pseudomonas syringae pv. syringae HS191]|nr:hypothetical protein PsyrH_14295 [Pseudomonas syringae pv. syringae HS191]